MPSLDIDVEIECSCGADLSNQSTGSTFRNGLYIEVEPCEDCLNKAHNEGYDEGYAAAQEKYEDQ